MSLSDDFVVNVRQVAQYPFKATVDLTDLLLLQQGGLGGPYRTTNAQGLFAALIGTGGIALGILPPPSLKGFLSSFVTTPLGARQGFNWYSDQNGVLRYQQNGVAGIWSFADTQLSFSIAPTGVKDAQLWPAFNLWQLGFDGQMKVAQQIEVGRNPGRPNELVTLDYLQTRGVTSFNKRNGAITLAASDIYFALGLDGRDPLVTAGWVNGTICNALASWYYNTPLVFSFNGRVGTITLTDADISFACNQPGAQPRTVTPPPYDYSTRIANTAFVDDAITDAKSTIGSDLAAYAPLNSPVFTGTPQAPTANLGTNTGQLATTAFVMAAVAESVAGVATFNGRSGNVVLVAADVTSAGGAALDSPAFVGTPTAPTPPNTASNGEVATCAWVLDQISAVGAGVVTWNNRSGFVTLQASDITGAGGALTASPAFTGTPTAPTPGTGAAGGQLATVAYVAANAGVTAFNTRTGAVALNSADISAAGGALVASPTFTGTPAAPTAAPGVNTTQLATTAFVTAAIAAQPAHLPLTGGTLTGNLSLPALVFPQYTANAWAINLLVDGSTDVPRLMMDGTNLGNIVVSPPVTSGLSAVYRTWYRNTDGAVIASITGNTNVFWTTQTSDRRLKENLIATTVDAVALINRLIVYEGDVAASPSSPPQHWDCALIADEVGDVIPSAYLHDPTGDTMDAIRDLPLIATLVRAVQQLSQQVADLTTARTTSRRR